jgi:hypothetical protein
MTGVGTLVVMKEVEHMTIAREAWEAHGMEVEEAVRGGTEIDHSSPLRRHGRVTRTSSWEGAMVVEEEGQVMGYQVDLGQVEGLEEEEEGYQVGLGVCDNREGHDAEA